MNSVPPSAGAQVLSLCIFSSLRSRCYQSGDDTVHYVPAHIGQREVAPGVAVGKALVIQSEQMQDGGVQVIR